jgi:hypothetical protein
MKDKKAHKLKSTNPAGSRHRHGTKDSFGRERNCWRCKMIYLTAPDGKPSQNPRAPWGE